MCYVAIENGPQKYLIYLLKMGIFYSYVTVLVYRRVSLVILTVAPVYDTTLVYDSNYGL